MKIAIDGPAGAGKSTIAKRLADRLGFLYIDTGAMYRAITWKAIRKGLNLEDQESLYRLAQTTDIHFEFNSGMQNIICDGENVTEQIRSPLVSSTVSLVAAVPMVRKVMVALQQKMAECFSVVMDGRDIGECVLPDADYKFFVTAGVETRAERRAQELAAKGYPADLHSIVADIIKRDQRDSNREVGALKVLPESIVIDTSYLNIDEVMNMIFSIIKGD